MECFRDLVDILAGWRLAEQDGPFSRGEPDIFTGNHDAIRDNMRTPAEHCCLNRLAEGNDFPRGGSVECIIHFLVLV